MHMKVFSTDNFTNVQHFLNKFRDNQKSYCPLNDLLHVSKESDNNKAPDADNHRISQTVQNSELQLLIRGLHGMLIRTRDGARVLVVGLRQRIEKCRSWKQSAAGAPGRLNYCPVVF